MARNAALKINMENSNAAPKFMGFQSTGYTMARKAEALQLETNKMDEAIVELKEWSNLVPEKAGETPLERGIRVRDWRANGWLDDEGLDLEDAGRHDGGNGWADDVGSHATKSADDSDDDDSCEDLNDWNTVDNDEDDEYWPAASAAAYPPAHGEPSTWVQEGHCVTNMVDAVWKQADIVRE